MDSKGFDLAIADLPRANRLTLHMLAAAAEHDRDAISARTSDDVLTGPDGLTEASGLPSLETSILSVLLRDIQFRRRIVPLIVRVDHAALTALPTRLTILLPTAA
jgi:hypothetical protein